MTNRPALTEDEKRFIKASGASIGSMHNPSKGRRRNRRPRFFVKTTVIVSCLFLALIALLSFAVNKAQPFYDLASGSEYQQIMSAGSANTDAQSDAASQNKEQMQLFTKAYDLRGYGYTTIVVLWLLFVGIMVFVYWIRSSKWKEKQRALKRRRKAIERKRRERDRERIDNGR